MSKVIQGVVGLALLFTPLEPIGAAILLGLAAQAIGPKGPRSAPLGSAMTINYPAPV
jgi:hypothetical protein